MMPGVVKRGKWLAGIIFTLVFFTACPLFPNEEGKETAYLQFPSGCVIAAEVARTPLETARGLMFRDHLNADEGMFFIFSSLDFHAFWMKNTKIPLDIIWLSPELRIIHIESNVPPCHEEPCPSYLPLQKAAYVLEVNSGVAEREGLRLGDSLVLLTPLTDK